MRHFTSLKLCKCSQILQPLPREASTPNIRKINHYWFNLLHTLICTIPLAEGLRSSFPSIELHKEAFDSSYLRIHFIYIRSKKDITLNARSIFISFSKTGTKGMNFSTGWIKLQPFTRYNSSFHVK